MIWVVIGFRVLLIRGGNRWQRHDYRFGGTGHFLFKILQGRNDDLRFPGVSAMHCLAVVPQGLLGEAFGVAAGPCAFRPCVAVTVQSDALNFQPAAAAGELGRPVRLAHLPVIGKERSGARQSKQHSFKLGPEADD